MRTAQKKQVVAFKSYVRTVIHEFLHHLDYEHFKLPETFHTEGFYKRESSLANELFRVTGIAVAAPVGGQARSGNRVKYVRSRGALQQRRHAVRPALPGSGCHLSQPRSLNRDSLAG
jgi:hypothetical protein